MGRRTNVKASHGYHSPSSIHANKPDTCSTVTCSSPGHSLFSTCERDCCCERDGRRACSIPRGVPDLSTLEHAVHGETLRRETSSRLRSRRRTLIFPFTAASSTTYTNCPESLNFNSEEP